MEGNTFNLSVITTVFHEWSFLESFITEERKTHFLTYHTFPFKVEAFYISPLKSCNHVQPLRTDCFYIKLHLKDWWHIISILYEIL